MQSSTHKLALLPHRDGVSEDVVAKLARLASIVESSEDAIISQDIEGTILTWNRGAAALYGYTAAEAIGQNMMVLVPAERFDKEKAMLARVCAGQQVQHFETVRIRKNGVRAHVSLTISPIREGDRVIGASHVARDISERKRLEAANAHLAAIVDSSEDAIISKDLSGSIQTWNASAERIYGYSAKEMIGHNISILLPSGQEREEHEILEKIRRGGRADHLETVRVSKGGVLRHVALTISPIRDRNGDIVGASHVAREITDRRRLEAANAQLAAIVEYSEDAIVSKDLNGVIRTWNASAERMYGYSAQEAIGQNMSFLLPHDRPDEEQEILSKLRRNERVEHFETTRLRKDGKLIDVSLTISPIGDASGAIVGASHVARDITGRKEFEQQMRQTQRLESLGVLAGGIAHDFNNLLTGIIGNGSLISELFERSHVAREYLQDLLLAADRAADLTRQLLAYSGRGQFVIGPLDVSTLVAEISTLIKASIPKTVAVRLNLENNLPPVEADRSQIQQLVMNLIINGGEAIGENRSGTVFVRTGAQHLDANYIRATFPGRVLTPGEYIYIEVRDDGCGMDEKTRARIFDPFFTTKFTGRGLGLAAALGIVHAHQGAIRVYSTPGEGSTFKVFFPASDEKFPRQPDAAAQTTAKSTVLVVDDEEVVRKVAKATLENHGYRVLLASNGKEAVETFSEAKTAIGLILLDLTMPVMGGEEALPLLRAIRGDVPVILSSGYSEADALRRFREEDVSGYVQKPYSSAQLRERIEAALEQRS